MEVACIKNLQKEPIALILVGELKMCIENLGVSFFWQVSGLIVGLVEGEDLFWGWPSGKDMKNKVGRHINYYILT